MPRSGLTHTTAAKQTDRQASGCMRLLGGFAWWFPCVWRSFVELREIIIYFMPLRLGAYEDMCPGFTPGSPSTVPNVIVVILPLTVPANDEPHSLQKHHPAPDNVSYTFTRSSPEIHLKPCGLNSA